MAGGGSGEGANKVHLEIAHAKQAAKNGNSSNLSKYQMDLLKWSKNVDKGYAWVILVTIWIILNTSLLPCRIYGLIYAKVVEIGEYNREAASWPSTTLYFTESFIGPIISMLAFYIPARSSFIIGQLFLTAGNALGYFSHSLILDTVSLGLMQGISLGFVMVPFMSVINEYFFKYRNIALGLALSGGTMSVYIFGPLFRYLLEYYPYRLSYLVMGGLGAASLIIVPLMKPNPKPRNPNMIAKEPLKRVSSLTALKARSSFRSGSAISYERRPSGMSIKTSVVSVNPFGSVRSISRSIHTAAVQNKVDAELGEEKCSTVVGIQEIGEDQKFEMSNLVGILKNVTFHLTWFIEAIYFWIFSIYTIVVIDMAVDKGIDRENAEYLISYWSLGELIGRLALTALVDLKYLSNRCLIILIALLLSISLGSTVLISDYYAMAALVTIISSLNSLSFIMLNGLLVDSLGEEQVTLGYGIASFLTGFTLLFRTQVVGYCRDILGTYDPLMFGMSFACLIAGIMWILETIFESKAAKIEKAREVAD